jgi:aspartate racemase
MQAAAKGDGQVASAVRDVREINFAAGVAYVVKPYAGSVTLFKAEPDMHEAELPEDLDWKRFVQGELEIKHLPGDHGRILFEPGLSAMAKGLTAGFQKVDAAREAVQTNGAAARVEMEF